MAPRITMSIGSSGEFALRLNPEGRDLLVEELKRLAPTSANDHFHLGTYDGAEVELRASPYHPTDTIIHAAKVLLRPDEWDRTHFPHVMDQGRP